MGQQTAVPTGLDCVKTNLAADLKIAGMGPPFRWTVPGCAVATGGKLGAASARAALLALVLRLICRSEGRPDLDGDWKRWTGGLRWRGRGTFAGARDASSRHILMSLAPVTLSGPVWGRRGLPGRRPFCGCIAGSPHAAASRGGGGGGH